MTHELAQRCLTYLALEEQSLDALRQAIACVRDAWNGGDRRRLTERIELLGKACQQSVELQQQQRALAEQLGPPFPSLTEIAALLPPSDAAELARLQQRRQLLVNGMREDVHRLHQVLHHGHTLLSSFLAQWLGDNVERYGPTGERLVKRETTL